MSDINIDIDIDGASIRNFCNVFNINRNRASTYWVSCQGFASAGIGCERNIKSATQWINLGLNRLQFSFIFRFRQQQKCKAFSHPKHVWLCPIYFLVKGRNILFSRSQGHSLYIWTATGLDLFAPIPARLPGLNYHDCHLTNVIFSKALASIISKWSITNMSINFKRCVWCAFLGKALAIVASKIFWCFLICGWRLQKEKSEVWILNDACLCIDNEKMKSTHNINKHW